MSDNNEISTVSTISPPSPSNLPLPGSTLLHIPEIILPETTTDHYTTILKLAPPTPKFPRFKPNAVFSFDRSLFPSSATGSQASTKTLWTSLFPRTTTYIPSSRPLTYSILPPEVTRGHGELVPPPGRRYYGRGLGLGEAVELSRAKEERVVHAAAVPAVPKADDDGSAGQSLLVKVCSRVYAIFKRTG